MNLLLWPIIIVEVIWGVSATFYVVLSLPYYMIKKILCHKQTGEPIL